MQTKEKALYFNIRFVLPDVLYLHPFFFANAPFAKIYAFPPKIFTCGFAFKFLDGTGLRLGQAGLTERLAAMHYYSMPGRMG